MVERCALELFYSIIFSLTFSIIFYVIFFVINIKAPKDYDSGKMAKVTEIWKAKGQDYWDLSGTE